LVRDRSQWRLDLNSIPIVVVGFGARSELGRVVVVAGPTTKIDATDFLEIKRAGVLTIFKTRNGLLEPSATTHYVHPSGRHSRGFLRAANLLIEGPEVAFLAMCLLEYLPSQVEYLWVDTSSISSLAYALVALRAEMVPEFQVPVINSFSSYDRLDKARFGYHERSLILVSATTSGTMSRKLLDKGFREERVITLFSLAQDISHLTVFCDLANDDTVNPKREFSAAADFVAADCPLCKSGSKPVRFVGDQFLADAISYSNYTMVAADAPKGLSALMDRYAGKEIFGLRARRQSELSPNELWVNVAKLERDQGFLKELQNLVDRYAPASTSLIVHAGSKECRDLAEIVKRQLRQTVKSRIQVVSIASAAALSQPIKGSAVAVMGCVGSGRAAQSISRVLRDLFGDRPRLYLAAIIKHSHADQYGKLRGDLLYNGVGPRHELVATASMELPILGTESAWARERFILTTIRERIELEPDNDELLLQINSRLEIIGTIAKGSCSNLFWPDAEGEDLRLRQTFAFWAFQYDDRPISQGDVFTTVASVLEHLRSGEHPHLVHNNFFHSLLSPACFGRFNDGIVQASILRAAIPQELNYAADDSASRAMLEILQSMSEVPPSPKGEALTEFLLALASRRLTLATQDLAELLNGPTPPHPIAAALFEYCREELLS
jgi:hypothetical protein